jgi:hypothetical protein
MAANQLAPATFQRYPDAVRVLANSGRANGPNSRE